MPVRTRYGRVWRTCTRTWTTASSGDYCGEAAVITVAGGQERCQRCRLWTCAVDRSCLGWTQAAERTHAERRSSERTRSGPRIVGVQEVVVGSPTSSGTIASRHDDCLDLDTRAVSVRQSGVSPPHESPRYQVLLVPVHFSWVASQVKRRRARRRSGSAGPRHGGAAVPPR